MNDKMPWKSTSVYSKDNSLSQIHRKKLLKIYILIKYNFQPNQDRNVQKAWDVHCYSTSSVLHTLCICSQVYLTLLLTKKIIPYLVGKWTFQHPDNKVMCLWLYTYMYYTHMYEAKFIQGMSKKKPNLF